jgi:DNA-binding NarL/FixJ family response regulator
MRILIVEDEPLVASVLRTLVELNPDHRITAIAVDLASANRAADKERPDLALVDIKLAGGSTGYSVAGTFRERGIPCLFTTGSPPPFEMPELVVGCMMKPYTKEDVAGHLKLAEDLLRDQMEETAF